MYKSAKRQSVEWQNDKYFRDFLYCLQAKLTVDRRYTIWKFVEIESPDLGNISAYQGQWVAVNDDFTLPVQGNEFSPLCSVCERNQFDKVLMSTTRIGIIQNRSSVSISNQIWAQKISTPAGQSLDTRVQNSSSILNIFETAKVFEI